MIWFTTPYERVLCTEKESMQTNTQGPTPAQKLVDECRELEIQLYGKRIELSMALGQRESAQHWQREMYAAINARSATREAGVI